MTDTMKLINLLIVATIIFVGIWYFYPDHEERDQPSKDDQSDIQDNKTHFEKVLERQFDALVDLKTTDQNTSNNVNALVLGLMNIQHMNQRQFELEDIKPFRKAFIEQDGDELTLKDKINKLDHNNLKPKEKDQLNQDIESLTQKINQVNQDYLSAFKAIKEIQLTEEDKSAMGMEQCILLPGWAVILENGNQLSDSSKKIKDLNSNNITINDISSVLEATNIFNHVKHHISEKNDLKTKLMGDGSSIIVETISGEDYITIYTSCIQAADIMYQSLLNNKGIGKGVFPVDLSLTSEQIEQLKSAVK
ncbi:MAG: hypothetical protein ACON5A_02350 [Candidatus Comchoanobacterales bacterium]